jgi:hypothetical protein
MNANNTGTSNELLVAATSALVMAKNMGYENPMREVVLARAAAQFEAAVMAVRKNNRQRWEDFA